MDFKELDTTILKYIKISYIDTQNEKYEIKTNLVSINKEDIELDYESLKLLNVACPQYSIVKFVTTEAMYIVQTKILKFSKKRMGHYTIILSKPSTIQRRQLREYQRAELKMAISLVCINEAGWQNLYLSQSVDLSAGGVKIKNLKSLNNGKVINDFVNFQSFKSIVMTLYLDSECELTFEANIVRSDKDAKEYAFEFINSNVNKTKNLSRFVNYKIRHQND